MPIELCLADSSAGLKKLHKNVTGRNDCFELLNQSETVIWCETVSLRTKPVSDQKKSVLVLVLVLQVWCCVVKHRHITLVVIMILKDKATFQALFIVSLFCAWDITTVEIKWRSLT